MKGAASDFWKNLTDVDQLRDFSEAAAFVPVVGVVGKTVAAADEAGAGARAAEMIQGIGAKIGRIASHLTRSDLSGAAVELRGVVTGWDHLTEVRNAAQGMRNQVTRITRLLRDPDLSAENRTALEGLLGRASRALDAAERALSP